MFIDKYPNNGIPYIRVSETYYVKENGKLKNKKRTILNLGPLSRFDDGEPDFLGRLRQSFRDGEPLIDELAGLAEGPGSSEYVTIRLKKGSKEAFSNPKNIGYFILDAMYDALGINDVLFKHKSNSRIEYDLNGLTKALAFGRALSPDSKSATWRARGGYLFDVVSSENVIEAFRALDALDELSVKIQRRMNTKISQRIGRNKTICFYDVTNYWFEIDDPDEDTLSADGAVVKEGLRKPGPSKAKNRKPIVQMGLFMDDNGIPVSYKIFPGNHIDQTTLRPTMKETLCKMGFDRTIVVSDGGLNSGKNLAHIISQGNGYIVSKSAKGSDKDVKAWIFDEDGYIWNKEKTFKIKSKARTRLITDESGNKMKITEKIISYWSKGQYGHALHENKKFIEYLAAVTEFPDKLKDKQPKLKKYIVETQADKKTGEIVDTVPILSLDTEKIESDLGLMGYYTLMTSELDMDEREVIDKYHGLSRIEDSFRVIKSDLEGRPVRVWTDEHINAHFLICFIALTMIRIIQFKILASEGKTTNSARRWEMGLSAGRIKNALAGFTADALSDGYYRFTEIDDDLARVFTAFGIDAVLEIPTEKEIRQLKYAIDKSVF